MAPPARDRVARSLGSWWRGVGGAAVAGARAGSASRATLPANREEKENKVKTNVTKERGTTRNKLNYAKEIPTIGN